MRLHLVKNCWFRSSVGLEQQPSKLWVLGSNPNGITTSKVKLPVGSLTCFYNNQSSIINHQ